MSLSQLIYISRPFGYDTTTLETILFGARHINAMSGLTGALICREDIYLQLLEGPTAAVEATYARIKRDGRHVDVTLLVSCAITARLFPNWDMQHDPARSWLWSAEQVWDGAPKKASESEIRAIFQRIAAEPHEAATAAI